MKILLAILLITIACPGFTQEKFYLYPNDKTTEIGGSGNIHEPPYLSFYKSDSSGPRPAILVCPGGGYTILAAQHEGRAVAEFYNSQGFAAFILMYRLNRNDQTGSRFPAQYEDFTTAIRFIKMNAARFNILPEKLGIIGFSAGGHLASMGATLIDEGDPQSSEAGKQISTRPAFAILIYPVISMTDSFAHAGSTEMLLGKNAPKRLRDSLSTYLRVTARTPPVFLVYANDDSVVPPENGVVFYNALRKHGIPAEFHIYDHGGHGFGLAPKDPVLNTWPMLSVEWLKRMGMTGK